MRWPRTWRTFWKPSSRPSWTASSKLSACGLRRAFSSSFRSTAIGIPRYAGGGVDAMPGGAIRRAGSLSLEDRRDALPEADAHRGEPGKPELLRALTCHEQYGGGAVADLRGITGGHLPTLLEGWDERRELLERRVATWPLVAVGGAARREGDRHELVLEAPLLVGRDRALVRAEGEAVRVLAADALPLGQDLRRLSHEHHGGREAPAREERPHAHDAQVVGANVLEDALLRMSLPEGSADGVDHHDFAHGLTSSG